MNKKLLFSLSSLATIATIAPVLVITSCAGEIPPVVNLTITAKTNPKLLEADIIVLEGSDLPAQLTVLKKLFDGSDLNATNQANFSVSIDKEGKIVTLTPKTGYTIDGKNALLSNAYLLESPQIVTDLKITTKPTPKLTKEDIAALEASDIAALEASDIANQFGPLGKLFEGDDFVSTNQDKFTVSIDKVKRIVTLTTIENYYIAGQNKLDSNEYSEEATPPANTDLKITAIQASATLSATEVTALTGTDAPVQLEALKKLFEGTDLKTENLTNFVVSVNTETKIVTLTANEGFTIGNQPKLDST
ncbi:MAG: hypothetical protein ACRDAW_01405, partial [Metamycoplasmataceae bacterium]